VERARITRIVVAVGTAASAVAIASCADDGNADNVNIVNEVELATDTTGGDEAASSFEIDIANFQFGPADAVVPVGTEVVWLNNDTDVHSIISTDDLFTSSEVFEPGESYAVTFTEPGTYAYTCGVHPFMEGTVTVE
jgi:plastocyanin